jgi:hypothetical protein
MSAERRRILTLARNGVVWLGSTLAAITWGRFTDPTYVAAVAGGSLLTLLAFYCWILYAAKH